MSTATVTDLTTVPPHPHGQEWAYALTIREERSDGPVDVVHFADGPTDLVSILIPGYSAIPRNAAGDEYALLERYRYAVGIAQLHQEKLLADAVTDSSFDPAAATEQLLTDLLASKAVPADVDAWDEAVPLVLIATDYAPATSRPAPTGNVLFVDPHTEAGLLESLDLIGVFCLFGRPGTSDPISRVPSEPTA